MSGVQPATSQPNACLQGGSGLSPTNPLETRATENDTEDCLFLKYFLSLYIEQRVDEPSSVYYPSDGGGAPLKDLPTVVWIHGGGYETKLSNLKRTLTRYDQLYRWIGDCVRRGGHYPAEQQRSCRCPHPVSSGSFW